jgi:hypothetical protein
MNPLDCQQLLVISICEVHYCLNHISIYIYISIVYIRIRIYHSHPIHLPWISNYLVNIPFISKSYPTNTWYLIPTYPIFISQAKKLFVFAVDLPAGITWVPCAWSGEHRERPSPSWGSVDPMIRLAEVPGVPTLRPSGGFRTKAEGFTHKSVVCYLFN